MGHGQEKTGLNSQKVARKENVSLLAKRNREEIGPMQEQRWGRGGSRQEVEVQGGFDAERRVGKLSDQSKLTRSSRCGGRGVDGTVH